MNMPLDINPNLNPTNSRQYQFLDNVLIVRESLLKGGFWDQETINRFVTLFSQFIDILEYKYDPATFTINCKVRKTTVKKMPNYRAESIFYYNSVGNAMMILLKEFKDRVIKCLINTFGNSELSYEIYFNIITNAAYTYNLTNVQCISDSIVQIIL